MHRHTCHIYMCKIKSVKNEMLNSSYKNNVNELFLTQVHTYHRTNMYIIQKCILLIYYMHIFYTFLFMLHPISVWVLNCVFHFILFFFLFALWAALILMKCANYTGLTHSCVWILYYKSKWVHLHPFDSFCCFGLNTVRSFKVSYILYNTCSI